MTERRTLSGRYTYFFKFVFPAFWILMFGGNTLLLWTGAYDGGRTDLDQEQKWIFLGLLIGGTVFLLSVFARFKKVAVDDRCLYVSNFFEEIALPLAQIIAVSENRFFNPRLVTVTFREDTAFGRSITFIPQQRWFGAWSGSPVVAELRTLAAIPDDTPSAPPAPDFLTKLPGMTFISSALAKLGVLDPAKLLRNHLVFFTLVLVSNGVCMFVGGEMIAALGDGFRRMEFFVVLPGAGLMVLTSLIGLVISDTRMTILRVQAVVVALLVGVACVWLLDIAINGIPSGVGFAWTPGILEAGVGYATVLVLRFLLRLEPSERIRLFYLPVWVGALAIPIDAGVLVRLVAHIGDMTGLPH